ncbi:unnamed protein product [Paramecium sonneborni]|uniref:Autophagy-related protein n=1 Tax=Paramecium sonneborni TaxID=65129 RepID=A0A8S1L234_9CILI|nr:unnamed protein product [Paramecium sonneborni]
MEFQYIKQNSFEQRYLESFKLKQKNPNLLPIIIEQNMPKYIFEKSKNPEKLQKFQKIAVNKTLSVEMLLEQLRQKYQEFVGHQGSLYFIVGRNKLLLNFYNTNCLEDLYQKYAEKDGWLYLVIKQMECLS